MRNNGHNNNRRMNGRNPNNTNRNNGAKGQNPLNRSFDSNGPGVKVRGSAANVAEKYVQLARDAQASGDHVAFENFMQHAEHYLRLINAANEQMRLINPNWKPETVNSSDDQDEGEEGEQAENQPQSTRRVYEVSDEQPSIEQPNLNQSMREPREFRQDREPRGDKNQERNQNRERFQRPRFEPATPPSEEGLEPTNPAPDGERRPRFNRFERNRNRRPYDNSAPREGAEQPEFTPAQQAAPAYEKPVYEKPAFVEQESFGLPAFITGGDAPKAAPTSEEKPPRQRASRQPRDKSKDIIVAAE